MVSLVAPDAAISGTARFGGAALLDLDGGVIERREAGLDDAMGAEALNRVVALAKELVAAAQTPVLGIGVGSPGIVDLDGVVLTAPNLGWTDFPLEAKLSAELDLPVLARNDANAAVLAEYTFGEAEADFMLIKIGRGVGAGLITGSRSRRSASDTMIGSARSS